jgi:hypothetical protein
LEKSKYEQSLESVRRFIATAEKELELYYRHVALYGDPNDRNPNSILDKPRSAEQLAKVKAVEGDPYSTIDDYSQYASQFEIDTMGEEISESEDLSEYDDSYEDDDQSVSETDSEDDTMVIKSSNLLIKK